MPKIDYMTKIHKLSFRTEILNWTRAILNRPTLGIQFMIKSSVEVCAETPPVLLEDLFVLCYNGRCGSRSIHCMPVGQIERCLHESCDAPSSDHAPTYNCRIVEFIDRRSHIARGWARSSAYILTLIYRTDWPQWVPSFHVAYVRYEKYSIKRSSAAIIKTP
jgi:hypothetical protein